MEYKFRIAAILVFMASPLIDILLYRNIAITTFVVLNTLAFKAKNRRDRQGQKLQQKALVDGRQLINNESQDCSVVFEDAISNPANNFSHSSQT